MQIFVFTHGRTVRTFSHAKSALFKKNASQRSAMQLALYYASNKVEHLSCSSNAFHITLSLVGLLAGADRTFACLVCPIDDGST